MTRKSLFFAFVFCLCAFVHLVGSIAFAADIEINETNFPDANFRAYVSEHFDLDDDGALSDTELSNAKNIRCWRMNITSLQGVEFLPALESLWCSDNQLLGLDVSHNPALKYLWCDNNQLQYLDVNWDIPFCTDPVSGCSDGKKNFLCPAFFNYPKGFSGDAPVLFE